MKYRKLRVGRFAIGVAVAAGSVAAGQESDPEGVRVPQRIEATRPPAEGASQGSGDRTEEGPALDADIDSRSVVPGEALEEHGPASAASPTGSSRLDALAGEHENLGKFVEAVKAAGLAESLTGDAAYTVFAPTDEAWDSITEDWMAPANRERLADTLRGHIVAGDVDQETVKDLQSVQTLEGAMLQISIDADQVMVDEARLVRPDIRAGNLRIHAIDKVLAAETRVSELSSSDGDRQTGEAESRPPGPNGGP